METDPNFKPSPKEVARYIFLVLKTLYKYTSQFFGSMCYFIQFLKAI